MSAVHLQGCRAYRARLDGVLDGAVSLETRHEVEAHAQTCAGCARELRAALEIRRWIDSSPEPELRGQAEDAFVHDVLERIGEDPVGDTPRATQPGTRSGLWPAASASALAALLVAAGWMLFLLPPEPEPVVAAPPELERIEVAVPAEPLQGTLPEPAPIDLVAFAAALEALAAGPFSPGTGLDSRDWFTSITAEFGGGAALRGARALLQDPQAIEIAPMAARLLGPRADLRDRRLLVRTLPETGLAGALALAERGPSGLKLLWDLACSAPSPEDPRPALASRALMLRSQAGEDPLPAQLDPLRNVGLAADLIVASGGGAAARLLDLYLADGQGEWLDAWEMTRGRDESLTAALGRPRRRRSSGEEARKLAAIERARFAPGLDFVIAALEEGSAAAARPLAALPGRGAAAALRGAAVAGRLPVDVEDLAWARLVEQQPAALLELMVDPPGRWSSATDDVVSSLALIVDSCPSARSLLVLASFETELTVEQRTRALLLAFEGDVGPELGSLFGESVRRRLRELTASERATLAAAAWVACYRLDDLPSEPSSRLLRALARPATGAVHHLRVVRSIETERARSTTRSL